MRGMIARKTGSLYVHIFCLRPVCAINISRDQSSLTFSTRDSILEIIGDRVSSLLEGLSTYF